MTKEKIINRSQVQELGEWLRGEGQRVVFTNGCFDILHVGHVRYLEQARALGDVLVLGLNTDASVRRLKGPSRPINSEDERAEVLAALECVSYVVLFDEQTPVETIELLRPDVHAKGGDYRVEDLPEAATVQAYGGEVAILPLVPGRSTTRLVELLGSAG